MIRIVGISLVSMLLMACSARQCAFDGAYLDAQEYPDLQSVDNGELPPRDPAYMIPPIPEQDYKAARQYTDGSGESRTDCLDRPPRLVVPQQS
ncbi:hypothetical protein [Oceanococcus atlanticus]|nr:hypothetical protein [Oceanococcus atlanticus]RZO85656.1 MAG: hypothetical protein EVA65_07325 [Oceanococcus sp.]